MTRSSSAVAAVLFVSVGIFGIVGILPGFDLPQAVAQTQQQRPRIRGRAHKIKVDSSPQQAAVYWDAGDKASPKDYGIAGYTPLTIKVPRGSVKIVVELQGFKPQE